MQPETQRAIHADQQMLLLLQAACTGEVSTSSSSLLAWRPWCLYNILHFFPVSPRPPLTASMPYARSHHLKVALHLHITLSTPETALLAYIGCVSLLAFAFKYSPAAPINKHEASFMSAERHLSRAGTYAVETDVRIPHTDVSASPCDCASIHCSHLSCRRKVSVFAMSCQLLLSCRVSQLMLTMITTINSTAPSFCMECLAGVQMLTSLASCNSHTNLVS